MITLIFKHDPTPMCNNVYQLYPLQIYKIPVNLHQYYQAY